MSILEEIRSTKEKEVEDLKRSLPMAQLDRSLSSAPPVVKVGTTLAKGGRGVIAEVKRSSPSRGDIDISIDPAVLARQYMEADASAVSVLTDTQYFKGSSADLQKVRTTVSLPLLRKDFIIDEIQIYESRLLGADILLLIVSLLNDDQLRAFREKAEGLGMSALVEAHTEEEVARAADSGARLIGVNNRDLATFDVSLETSLRLRDRIPGDSIAVSESGVIQPADAHMLYQAGYDAVLIGEGLVRSSDKKAFVESVRAK